MHFHCSLKPHYKPLLATRRRRRRRSDMIWAAAASTVYGVLLFECFVFFCYMYVFYIVHYYCLVCMCCVLLAENLMHFEQEWDETIYRKMHQYKTRICHKRAKAKWLIFYVYIICLIWNIMLEQRIHNLYICTCYYLLV